MVAKEEAYQTVRDQLAALLPGCPDFVAAMATVAAVLNDNLDHVFSIEVERAFRNLPDKEDDGLGRIIATSGTPHKWLEKQGAPPPEGRSTLQRRLPLSPSSRCKR